ncbi:MAG: outer membrane beta-barrel protein [Ferruginibacter sp.]
MISKFIFSASFIFLPAIHGFAQTGDSVTHNIPQKKLKITGYIDTYYAYYTDSAGAGDFQKFASVSPRCNRFWLNTAQLSVEYNAKKIRGIVTIQYGDITQTSLPPPFNNIMEAHAGVMLLKNLWFDAGLFRTHFGTESVLPKENLVSSLSVNTYYEFCNEAALRLNYVPNEKWAFSLYWLKGYNLYVDNNNKRSAGALITYTHGNYYMGYCNYIGDDSPKGDSARHLRIQQNIFFNYQHKKIKFQAGFDNCIQQNADYLHPNLGASMYSGLACLKYQLKEKFAVSARAEIFKDPQGFMTGVVLTKDNFYTGYKLHGYTLAAEYKPTQNSYIRIEGRQLQMERNEEIFRWNGKNSSSRFELMINAGISFSY